MSCFKPTQHNCFPVHFFNVYCSHNLHLCISLIFTFVAYYFTNIFLITNSKVSFCLLYTNDYSQRWHSVSKKSYQVYFIFIFIFCPFLSSQPRCFFKRLSRFACFMKLCIYCRADSSCSSTTLFVHWFLLSDLFVTFYHTWMSDIFTCCLPLVGWLGFDPAACGLRPLAQPLYLKVASCEANNINRLCVKIK